MTEKKLEKELKKAMVKDMITEKLDYLSCEQLFNIYALIKGIAGNSGKRRR